MYSDSYRVNSPGGKNDIIEGRNILTVYLPTIDDDITISHIIFPYIVDIYDAPFCPVDQ